MKKLIFGVLATAMFFVTSCERPFDEGRAAAGEAATVSVNLGFPMMQTRAYSDGKSATELKYAVYENKNSVLSLLGTYPVTTDILISKQIDFQLVTGRTYTFVFWAAAPSEGTDWESPYTVDFAQNGATMTVDYSKAKANDDRNDAFFASLDKEITGDVQMTVQLTRPFAQINVGTNDYEVAEAQGCAPDLSKIFVSKAYKKLDLVSGVASEEQADVTFAYSEINADQETFPVPTYEYMAMAYVLASTEEEVLSKVQFTYKEGEDGEETVRTVGSVPVKRNHRTNMYGQVLTSTASVNVVITPEYEETDYNYSQLLFAAAVGGTAVLEGDVDLNEHGDVLTFTRDAVIDLNGNTITGLKGKDGAIRVTNGAHVTIKGNGKMISEDPEHSTVIWVADENSSVTIEDGYFEGKGTDDQLIYCQLGTIYIKGGTFKLPDHNFTLNCLDASARAGKATFVVTGGKFWKFDPSDSSSENPHANWVAAGYKSVKTVIDGEDWYVVVPDDTIELSSTETNNLAEAISALAESGATEATILFKDNGTYSLKAVPNTQQVVWPSDTKLTFIGNGKDTNVENADYFTAQGCEIEFRDLTLKVFENPTNHTAIGFKQATKVSMTNVDIYGEFHVFAGDASFEGCNFYFGGGGKNQTRYGLYCESAGKTTLKDCVFDTSCKTDSDRETKGILVYSAQGNTEMGDIDIDGCKFIVTGKKSTKAAIEIHSELFEKAGTLTISNTTCQEDGYQYGLWREINGGNNQPTTYYTVIVDGVKVQTAE
ncbi:MAG: hypothetical protein J1E04_05730 [Alistipes sp.]|nr:hypothetical protein [Alistipes sp.]